MSGCIGSTLSNTTNNSCPFEGSLEKMRKQKSRISCLKRLFHEDLKDGKWKLKVFYRKSLSYLVLLYPKHNILDLLSYENVFSFFFSNNMEKVLRSEIELCCFSFILKRGKQISTEKFTWINESVLQIGRSGNETVVAAKFPRLKVVFK